MLILLVTLCIIGQSCNYRLRYHAGNHKKFKVRNHNKNTFWYYRISIAAQTQIFIQ